MKPARNFCLFEENTVFFEDDTKDMKKYLKPILFLYNINRRELPDY